MSTKTNDQIRKRMNRLAFQKTPSLFMVSKWLSIVLVFFSVAGCSPRAPGVHPTPGINSVAAGKPATSHPKTVRDDFDGDGRTDPAKFDSFTGTVWWLNTSTGTWEGKWLGSEKFTYVGASDFDGDGKTDPAKFVPSTGTVWWVRSRDGKVDGKWLGSDTFTYVSGSDFDGDGKTDPAKFDPATGMFEWIRSSDGNVDGRWLGSEPSTIQAKIAEFYKNLWHPNKILGNFFAGCNGSGVCLIQRHPVIGGFSPSYVDGKVDGKWLGSGTFTYVSGSDFDGDGKTDLAKFVAGTGMVLWIRSSDGKVDGKWLGSDTFTYVPASDFDGDGKTDPAKFYPGTGNLMWLKSTTGTWDGTWLGTGTYTYVSGADFNGDGKTDPAKYDASTHILSWLNVSTGTWTNIDMGTGTYTLANGR